MIAIFRTGEDTLRTVVREAKYALPGRPNLTPGDTILLALRSADIRDGRPPVRYRMEFVRAYEDQDGESVRLWGRQWKWMIEASNCQRLAKPFDIQKLQVTDKNYAQGGTVVYVEPEDQVILSSRGLLNPSKPAV